MIEGRFQIALESAFFVFIRTLKTTTETRRIAPTLL